MDNSLQVPLIVLCLLVVCYRLVRYFHSGEHFEAVRNPHWPAGTLGLIFVSNCFYSDQFLLTDLRNEILALKTQQRDHLDQLRHERKSDPLTLQVP